MNLIQVEYLRSCERLGQIVQAVSDGTIQTKFLQSNERLVTIASVVCDAAPTGTVLLCIILSDAIHDGRADRCYMDFFPVSTEGPSTADANRHYKALLFGKQVIVVLDDRGNPQGYRPALAHGE